MTTNKPQQILIVLSVLALGIGGAFAAWVDRPAAALQLTAPGLAEFVKFLPESRLGLLPIQRLYFLLPVAAAAISLPLPAANRQLALPGFVNVLLRVAVLPFSLAILSPVWSPGVLLNAEFRLQTIAAAVAVGLAIITPVFSRLSLRWLVAGISLAAVISTGLALQQFFLADQAIANAYAEPITLGWGGWLTIAGTIGIIWSVVSGHWSLVKDN